MNNLREVNDDILKDWLEFREEQISTFSEEDRKHFDFVEEISQKILKNVPNKNRKYVEKQIEKISYSFYDYTGYLNEKYYMSGFSDVIKLIAGSLEL